MIHYYTNSEVLANSLVSDTIVILKDEIGRLQRRLREEEDSVRTAWFAGLLNCTKKTIKAEAENGSTLSLLGASISITTTPAWNEKGVPSTSFTIGGNNETILIPLNKASLYDNGTLQFFYGGKAHYVCISNWDDLMSQQAYT